MSPEVNCKDWLDDRSIALVLNQRQSTNNYPERNWADLV